MQFKPKFLLFILLLFAGTCAWAQAGSFGDPVVNIDFGSNGVPEQPITSYFYTTSTCPNDGYYTLGTSTGGCFGNTWHTVTHDHTGNPGGYMMIVNAASGTGEFFKQATAGDALCENTTYEFSAYIMNLIVPGGSGYTKPDISFIIETDEGLQLNLPYNTGDIPETPGSDGWQRYHITFKTPLGTHGVVIKMVNRAPGGADHPGNDLLLDDITFRAFGPVVQADFLGGASVIPDVCQGNSKSFDITATPGPGYMNAQYQWQKNDGSGWNDMPGETSTSLHIDILPTDPVGTYQYKLGVAEGDNISSPSCRVYSNSVTINVTAFPVAAIFGPSSVCKGEPITLTASGGATYKWTLPDLTTSTQNPLVIPSADLINYGDYNVEVTSAAGCMTPMVKNVIVNLKPVIDMDDVQPACKGVGVPLKASVHDPGTDTYSYSWFPTTGLTNANAANITANPDISTDYTVTVTNNRTQCSDTRQVHVVILDVPVASAGGDKKIFEGQSVTLDGGEAGNVTYSWSPPDYLDNPHSRTPTARPPHTTPYVLTVTPANGCSIDEDEMTVTVYEKIVIPSTFTPNNDGTNDLWNIEALETYPDGVISVFTRNGKQVFQSRGYGKPWDGKLNGNVLPTGTYYYVIDLKNNTPKLSGWVLLIR